MILALGLLIFGGYEQVTNARHSDLQLIGETVTVSYVADPSVGHGQFRLKNDGEIAQVVTVESAWYRLERQS